MKQLFKGTSICVLAILLPSQAWANAEFQKAEGEWTSVWEKTAVGTMTSKTTFHPSGKMVYVPGGTVYFESADDAGHWKGYWVESSAPIKCDTKKDDSHYWGLVEFQFNETYSEFDGHWEFCGKGEIVRKWTGKRISE
jgi:hypothetical protein